MDKRKSVEVRGQSMRARIPECERSQIVAKGQSMRAGTPASNVMVKSTDSSERVSLEVTKVAHRLPEFGAVPYNKGPKGNVGAKAPVLQTSKSNIDEDTSPYELMVMFGNKLGLSVDDLVDIVAGRVEINSQCEIRKAIFKK